MTLGLFDALGAIPHLPNAACAGRVHIPKPGRKRQIA